ncbi:Bug family tripartite tricarboxylate transporter substrate binding protein [Aquabacterium sp. J223]|uniref:Bug family tripartite tricarboxylate transporter substrate binding protein n=1 Tax=Aquabacterium sp. J223 TaxID=2898431 RepID=UPI0021AD6EBF|nr:tripartite tricarboxylate transporter substrate binding protein [Aquabacterium sp. J223]UUX96238.1 tripartite tricarboxylate transporter substrate binding protein [Aquabacterium sp. J223]
MKRRTTLVSLLAAGIAAPAAWAQPAWPSKPVRIVVPAPPGSSLDVIARLLADKLKDRWGQPVVVENKPGAGGLLGVDVAAKAPPDGHVIAVGFNGPIAFAPFLYRKLPYDPAKDLLPVVMTTLQSNVLAVNANLPVKTPREFVAFAKERAGKLNFASVGLGSSSHLTMELLLAEAGAQGTHVPYNGSPPAAMSVGAGETDALVAAAPALLPLARGGKLRLIATTGRQRMESLKELPTLVESGLPNVEGLIWNGLFVAAGTPDAVVQKLNADVNAVLADPAVKAQFDTQGLQPGGGSVAEFRQQVAADTKRWGAVIERLGLKIDP